MMVSKKVISVSETSAVNLIVGWCLFTCAMNCVIFPLFVLFRSFADVFNVSFKFSVRSNGALAVYFNDSGHVPLSECLLRAFNAFSAWFSFSSADSVWL